MKIKIKIKKIFLIFILFFSNVKNNIYSKPNATSPSQSYANILANIEKDTSILPSKQEIIERQATKTTKNPDNLLQTNTNSKDFFKNLNEKNFINLNEIRKNKNWKKTLKEIKELIKKSLEDQKGEEDDSDIKMYINDLLSELDKIKNGYTQKDFEKIKSTIKLIINLKSLKKARLENLMLNNEDIKNAIEENFHSDSQSIFTAINYSILSLEESIAKFEKLEKIQNEILKNNIFGSLLSKDQNIQKNIIENFNNIQSLIENNAKEKNIDLLKSYNLNNIESIRNLLNELPNILLEIKKNSIDQSKIDQFESIEKKIFIAINQLLKFRREYKANEQKISLNNNISEAIKELDIFNKIKNLFISSQKKLENKDFNTAELTAFFKKKSNLTPSTIKIIKNYIIAFEKIEITEKKLYKLFRIKNNSSIDKVLKNIVEEIKKGITIDSNTALNYFLKIEKLCNSVINEDKLVIFILLLNELQLEVQLKNKERDKIKSLLAEKTNIQQNQLEASNPDVDQQKANNSNSEIYLKNNFANSQEKFKNKNTENYQYLADNYFPKKVQ